MNNTTDIDYRYENVNAIIDDCGSWVGNTIDGLVKKGNVWKNKLKVWGDIKLWRIYLSWNQDIKERILRSGTCKYSERRSKCGDPNPLINSADTATFSIFMGSHPHPHTIHIPILPLLFEKLPQGSSIYYSNSKLILKLAS